MEDRLNKRRSKALHLTMVDRLAGGWLMENGVSAIVKLVESGAEMTVDTAERDGKTMVRLSAEWSEGVRNVVAVPDKLNVESAATLLWDWRRREMAKGDPMALLPEGMWDSMSERERDLVRQEQSSWKTV